MAATAAPGTASIETTNDTMTTPPHTFQAADLASWRAAYRSSDSNQRQQPLLVHLNGDTTWLLQLPIPPDDSIQQRQRFNILLDPWLQGPQSDVASWFSTQWHVVAPCVHDMAELQLILGQLESESDTPPTPTHRPTDESPTSTSYIDAVAISHEFTDHCHEATLRELPATTPIFATDKAADLVRGWNYFDTVVTMPGYSFASSPVTAAAAAAASSTSTSSPHTREEYSDWRETLSVKPLPSWLGIGRVVTPGNSLYYHSAVLIVFDSLSSPSSSAADAVIYSPHGIQPSDLHGISSHPHINTLALLHGLHDVKIWMTKQLNLGAHNGLEAVRACGARYWVATHDEVKSGGGFIAPLLRRVQWTVSDAVSGKSKGRSAAKDKVKKDQQHSEAGYDFVELGSGDGLVLSR